MLFAEVFGGEQSPRDELPTSVSPPFSDGAEEEASSAAAAAAAADAAAADKGGATMGDLMQHMATWKPKPPKLEAMEESNEKEEQEEEVVESPQAELEPVIASVLSRRVLGTAGPMDRVRVPAEDVEAALTAAGIPLELDAFPPIEAFDDSTYELRDSGDWLSADPTYAQYLSLETGQVVIRRCEFTRVRGGYDAEANQYNATDCDVGTEINVPRVLLFFDGEELDVFVARLKAALDLRTEAIQTLQYNLCVRDMPTEKGEVVLPLDVIDRVLQLVFNTDKLKTSSSVDSSELLKEVYSDFVQVVNSLTFNFKVENPAANMVGDGLSAVKLPSKEARPVPEKGQKTIPAHERLSEDGSQQFAAMSYTGMPQAIKALTKIISEVELAKLTLFSADYPESVKLKQFKESQELSFSELKADLCALSNTSRDHIRYQLHEADETWKEQHEMGFTVMINKRLQDSLRDMVESGLRDYSDFVDSLCPTTISVNAIDDVVVTVPENGRGTSKSQPPLISVQLVLHDENAIPEPEETEPASPSPEPGSPRSRGSPSPRALGLITGYTPGSPSPEAPSTPTPALPPKYTAVKFDTATADIKATVLEIYDFAVATVQEIPEVELPYSKDYVFELRMKNNGEMPVFHLRAPQLEEDLVQEIRGHVEAQMEAAMQPLEDWLKLFDPYVEFIELDLDEAVTKLFEDETKTLDDYRKEVDYHRDQQDMILNTIPSSVKFAGLVEVHCSAVRDYVGKKHGELAEKIMQAMTTDCQTKADSVCKAFEEMLEKVQTKPANIEELTEQREFVEELPRMMEEQQDAIDRVSAIKDQLEECQFGISDDAFDQMWVSIMWPATIAQSAEDLGPELDKKQQEFEHVQDGEMMTFEKELKKAQTSVKAFSAHSDLSMVEAVSEEAKEIAAHLAELTAESKKFKSRAALFGTEQEDYVELTKAIKDFEPYQALWVTADTWIKKKQEWLDGQFDELDADELEATVNDCFKSMFKSARRFTQKEITGCAEMAVPRPVKRAS